MDFSNIKAKNKYDIVIVATNNFNQSKRNVSKITTCPTWGAIIRKKILEEYHIKFCTDLQNTEDNLFFYQLLTFTNSIYKSKRAKYNYRIGHNGNLSSKLNNQEYKKNVLLNLLDQVELFYDNNSKNSKIKDHTKRFLADMIFYQLLVSKLSLNKKIIIYKKLQKLIKKIGYGFTNKENLDFKLILFYTIFDLLFLT